MEEDKIIVNQTVLLFGRKELKNEEDNNVNNISNVYDVNWM